MNERDPDRAVSQTVRAQLALRDLILSGRLRPGERISELQAVETTGASRTPVRMALVRLEEEGLLEAIPSGGFMVKAFTERDILDSIELRGVLEGLAARFAAERGVSARDLEPLKESLAELDKLVTQDVVSVEAFSSYVTMNARFHALLTELSRSAPLMRQIDRASALPFASPSAFVMAQSVLPEAHQILIIAQDHHRIVVDAIENREGARAEAVMREHARLAARNLPAGAAQSNPSRSVAGAGADPFAGERIGSEDIMRFVQKWTTCTVHTTRNVTSAIREIVLRPEAAGVEPYAIGSHVEVGVLIDGRPETRCYSLVGDFNPTGYRIAVRLAPDSRGGGSRYMWTLKPGARIEISSPASLLEADWSKKSCCLIAGGIRRYTDGRHCQGADTPQRRYRIPLCRQIASRRRVS